MKLLVYLFIAIVLIVDNQQFFAKADQESSIRSNLNSILNQTINLIEQSAKTIRLKSALAADHLNERARKQPQKLFWSFKRIYSLPKFVQFSSASIQSPVQTLNEVSQNELMISFDAEVHKELAEKFSVDVDGNYDLIIYNLTYADSGLYKCDLWNQKSIYYKLIVLSAATRPEIVIDRVIVADGDEQSSSSSSAEASMKLGSEYEDEARSAAASIDYYSGISKDRLIGELSNVTLKCFTRHAYPYPTVKWFNGEREIVSSPLEQISVYLRDKMTNTIESRLQLLNVDYQLHLNNITCRVTQSQEDNESFDTLLPIIVSSASSSSSSSSSKQSKQLILDSEPLQLNIAFRPIVNVDVIKINGTNNQTFQPLMLTSPATPIIKQQHQRQQQHQVRISLFKESNILFKCKFKANPIESTKINWILNGMIINQNESMTNELISLAKIRDNLLNEQTKSINLTCEVANSIGKGSFTYEIDLLYEPVVKVAKRVHDADELSSIRIECQVDASPMATLVQWRRYDRLLLASTTTSLYDDSTMRVVSDSAVLEIASIDYFKDSGTYFCIANNNMNDSFGVERVGNQMVKVELNVRFAPKMEREWQKVAVNLTQFNATTSTQNVTTTTSSIGRKQSIVCVARANPVPSFVWLKNGVKLSEQARKYTVTNVATRSKNLFESVLTINELDETDVNERYECDATNSLGSRRLTVELVPLSKPERIADLRYTHFDFQSISVTWKAGFDGGLAQQFQLSLNNDTIVQLDDDDERKKLGSNDVVLIRTGPSSLNLTNLVHNTLYSIRMMSKNSMGDSEWSELLSVRTSDIYPRDAELLPKFDSLFFNVPKRRLEFTFSRAAGESYKLTTPNKHVTNSVLSGIVMTTSHGISKLFFDGTATTSNEEANSIPICFKISGITNKNMKRDPAADPNDVSFDFKKCARIKTSLFYLNQFSFESYLSEHPIDFSFQPDQIRSLKVAVCFQQKPAICSRHTSAIIDMYNTISHSSLLSNANLNGDGASSMITRGNGHLDGIVKITNIPVALIVGICVCILSLLILLLVSVIFCIRKRNFKLCKSLLTQNVKPAEKPSSQSQQPAAGQQQQQQQFTNKSFNIDIASISAPVGATIAVNGVSPAGSFLGLAATSNTSNTNGNEGLNYMNTLMSGRRIASLTATANSIIKHKNQEIMVTEDGERKTSSAPTSNSISPNEQNSTGMSNCSSSSTTIASNSGVSGVGTSLSNQSNTMHHQHATGYMMMFDPFDHSSTHVDASTNMASIMPTKEYTQQQIDLFKTATFIETYNSSGAIVSSGSGSATNSDPVAINNSLSSNNSTADSPTYGYNVTSSTNIMKFNNNNPNHNRHHQQQQQQQQQNEELITEDNLLYIKTAINSHRNNHTTFPPLDHHEQHDYLRFQPQQQQQHNNHHNNQQQKNDPPESGYSTPSRPKKVVYEVIV